MIMSCPREENKQYPLNKLLEHIGRYSSDYSDWINYYSNVTVISAGLNLNLNTNINVKDFGAKGDGVTDDTAAIQAAIAHSSSLSGVLYLPAGNYFINSAPAFRGVYPACFTLNSNTTIVGDGPSVSIFKLGENLPKNVLVFSNTGAINVTYGTFSNQNIILKNFGIDGSALTFPDWNKGEINPITYGPSNLPLTAVRAVAAQFLNVDNVVVDNCSLRDFKNKGFFFGGCKDLQFTNNKIENCGKKNYAAYQLWVAYSGTFANPANRSINPKITNNVFKNTDYCPILIGDIRGGIINNNVIDGGYEAGMHLTEYNDGITVSNNIIKNIKQYEVSAHGLETWGLRNVIISDNNFYNCQKGGIVLGGGENIIIEGNTFVDTGSAHKTTYSDEGIYTWLQGIVGDPIPDSSIAGIRLMVGNTTSPGSGETTTLQISGVVINNNIISSTTDTPTHEYTFTFGQVANIYPYKGVQISNNYFESGKLGIVWTPALGLSATGPLDESSEVAFLNNSVKINQGTYFFDRIVLESSKEKYHRNIDRFTENQTILEDRYQGYNKDNNTFIDYNANYVKQSAVYGTGPNNELGIYEIWARNGGNEGTASSGTTNTIVLSSSASFLDETYKYSTITINSGTGSGQSRRIDKYNGTTRTATISGVWSVIPNNTSKYTIAPRLDQKIRIGQGLQIGAATPGFFTGNGSINAWGYFAQGLEITDPNTGHLQLQDYTSTSKPAAGPVGSMIFITTTNKPAFSDGTNWRYADGSLV